MPANEKKPAILSPLSNRFDRGTKSIYNPEDIITDLQEIPLSQRRTMRSTAMNLGVSTSTLKRQLDLGEIVKHTSTLKPYLRNENKMERFTFCSQEVQANGKLKEMYDRVYLDEKWFKLTEASTRYYVGKDEPLPVRRGTSRRHITQVMFLVVVAKPRYDYHRKTMWDGKIGIFEFGEITQAVNDSSNRKKGTDVWKGKKVNAKAYREMIIKKVLPAIAEKWPFREKNNHIYLQHDNATPHKIHQASFK